MDIFPKRSVQALFLYFACSLYSNIGLTADVLKVAVVNYPLKYFTERIAGDAVDIIFPVPKNVDPAFWMPDAKSIGKFQTADLIILNGANYAKWTNKVSLPRLRMVDSSKTFSDTYVNLQKKSTHSHGPGGKHSHSGYAFTTWLDFSLAIEHSNNILKALIRKQPSSKRLFNDNHAGLVKDLNKLDRSIKEIINKHTGKFFIASHPVYQYFSKRYGVEISSVLWEPDQTPTENQWSELTSILQSHPSKWMIWEDQPSVETANRLKTVGIEVLVFNPTSNTPAQGDFLEIMRENIVDLQKAYQ